MRSETKNFSQRRSEEKHNSNNLINKNLFAYFNNHLSAVVTSAGRLIRAPIATVMTLIVIAIAFALPIGLFLFLENVQNLSQNWNDSSQISVYLKSNISANQAQALLTQLKKQSDIAQVKYISPQQGLTELQNITTLKNDLSTLSENPLPAVLLVQPKNSLQSTALNNLLNQLQLLPQVDLVQLDMQWVKRLAALLDLGKRLVYALGFLLCAGVLFIVGNTIHLNLEKYQREIEIFKLIGATDGFIRRPFLYTGILYGLFGSIFALILVGLLFVGLTTPVHKLANLYDSAFQLTGLTLKSSLVLLLAGTILGMIGAWLAIGKHLRAHL